MGPEPEPAKPVPEQGSLVSLTHILYVFAMVSTHEVVDNWQLRWRHQSE